jgi:hypothetical protein
MFVQGEGATQFAISLNSHISARGEIRGHGASTLWLAIEQGEHEENQKSVAEHE